MVQTQLAELIKEHQLPSNIMARTESTLTIDGKDFGIYYFLIERFHGVITVALVSERNNGYIHVTFSYSASPPDTPYKKSAALSTAIHNLGIEGHRFRLSFPVHEHIEEWEQLTYMVEQTFDKHVKDLDLPGWYFDLNNPAETSLDWLALASEKHFNWRSASFYMMPEYIGVAYGGSVYKVEPPDNKFIAILEKDDFIRAMIEKELRWTSKLLPPPCSE